MNSARAIIFTQCTPGGWAGLNSVYSGWVGGVSATCRAHDGRARYIGWGVGKPSTKGRTRRKEGREENGTRAGAKPRQRRSRQLPGHCTEHGRSHDRPTDRRRTARPRARRDVSANVNGANRLHHPNREGGRESAKCPPHHFFSKFICRKNAISAYTMRTRWACTVYRVGGWEPPRWSDTM